MHIIIDAPLVATRLLRRLQETYIGLAARSAADDVRPTFRARAIEKEFAMKKQPKWILASLLAGGMTISGLAVSSVDAASKKQRDPDIQKALKEEYPDAQTQIIRTDTVNGVKVSDVKVTTKDGESMARITEFGDFLVYGEPRGGGSKAISAPARATLQGLFKGNPSDVDVMKSTSYLVDVDSGGGKLYRFRYDAVGRLKDIESRAEIRREDEGLEKASGGDTKKIQQYAEKYLDDPKISNIWQTPENDGFYVVDAKEKDGMAARLTISNDGRVFAKRQQIDKKDIPEPVTAAIGKFLNNEKIKEAYRSEFEYYQLEQQGQGGDTFTVKIRPNGDILAVDNARANDDEKAVTASAKESSGSSKKKNKNND